MKINTTNVEGKPLRLTSVKSVLFLSCWHRASFMTHKTSSRLHTVHDEDNLHVLLQDSGVDHLSFIDKICIFAVQPNY